MSTKLLQVIDRAERIAAERSDGHLPLGWRMCVWKQFNAELGAESQRRRDLWCAFTARDLARNWSDHWLSGELTSSPQLVSLLAKIPSLFGEGLTEAIGPESIRRSQICAWCKLVGDDLDNVLWLLSSDLAKCCVGGLAAVAWRFHREDDDYYTAMDLYDAVDDEERASTICDGDPETRGIEAFAEAACQSELYAPPERYADDRRRFWRQWLDYGRLTMGHIDFAIALLES